MNFATSLPFSVAVIYPGRQVAYNCMTLLSVMNVAFSVCDCGRIILQ